MKRLLAILMLLMPAAACLAPDAGPWAAWPYKLTLRVTQPELADFTGLARVRINLGPDAAKDWADVRVLDDKGREQPWRVMSASSAGDVDAVFYTVKGCRDYALIYGAAGKTKPNYDVPFNVGKAIIDDGLPDKAYIHGLWSWAQTPVLSGAYSHANTVTDRLSYHGTSEIRNVPLQESTEINQYVWLDPDDPPEEIMVRLVFEQRPGANSWDDKNHVNLYWGERSKIKDMPGRSLKIGELPEKGKWQRLHVKVEDLLGRTNFRWQTGGVPDLFGVEFVVDKGRAFWDLTTLGETPAETEVAALERAAGAKPAFVWQKLASFKVEGSDAALTELRFIAPSAGDCAWDFGDGASGAGSGVTHVFSGQETRKVTLKLDGADCARDVESFRGRLRPEAFAVELVSCPFIVPADEKALFNLRFEASLPTALDVEARATLLDDAGKELRRESATVKLLPGDKHPAFKAWSLDLASGGDTVRVRFEVLFGGRAIATRETAVVSSRKPLDALTLAGDRFVDKAGNPVVVLVPSPSEPRVEIAPDGAARGALDPSKLLIVGRVPVVDFGTRLAAALGGKGDSRNGGNSDRHPDTVKVPVTVSAATSSAAPFAAVDARPGWSLPPRQLLALATTPVEPATQVVLVTSAWEMMLAGVPARTAADALSASIDQLRLRSGAGIVLVAPVVYAGLEDLARQYAVAIKMLGIEKNVPVVDLYSRSVRLGDEDPGLLKTSRIDHGVAVQTLHPRVAEMTIETIAAELAHPAPASRE